MKRNASRVYVRLLTSADANDDYVSWINDPEVTYYLDTHRTTLPELKTYIEGRINKDDCRFLGVFLKENDKLIGTAKFEPIDWKMKVGEFGMMIGDRSVWGQGLGVESAHAALAYAFEELKLSRVELGVYAANVQAFKTFLRAGFEVTVRDTRAAKDGNPWLRIRMAFHERSWPPSEKKICLFMQRNFARVGDAFAAALKKNHPELEFCTYLQHRNALVTIKQANLIDYTSIILDEDMLKEYKGATLDLEYLRSIELSYGLPNLWPYLTADRVLMHGQLIREYPYDQAQYSHEDLLRMTQVMAKRIETFLDTEKPSHLVCTIIGSLGSLLVYYMARARGIKTHVICGAQFENRFIFSQFHNDASMRKELGEAYGDAPSKDALESAARFVKAFRDRPAPPNTVQDPNLQALNKKKQLQFLAPDRIAGTLSALFREYRLYYGNPDRDDYSTVNPNHYFIDRLRRKFRNLRGIEDIYDAVMDEPFAFFPLHMEPETALSVWAPGVEDQLIAVRKAAESLPVGWKLYVKEHPQMAGFRPRDYYLKLKNIPNVKLVNSAVSSFDLIRKCRLCIIITSTVGFEAVLFGKPVVTLGNHVINDLSFVKHCDAITDLPAHVKTQSEEFEFREEELLHFLAKIIENSAVVDLLSLWLTEHSKEDRLRGIEPLAELFARRVGL